MSNVIEDAVIRLLNTEPFYANLILNMRRHKTDKILTAGVNITSTVNLYYNEDFVKTLKVERDAQGKVIKDEVAALLRHECHHVIGNHFERFHKVKEDKYKLMKNFNLAADFAANELNPDLPDEIDFGGKKARTCKVKFLKQEVPHTKEKMHAEYYFDLLKEETEKNGGGSPAESMDSIDDHDLWNEGEENEQVRNQVLKGTLEKAANGTKEAGGHVPDYVEEAINKLGKSKTNWKQILHSFVNNAIETKIESSRKKRHRRYGVLYPGDKIEELLHIGVCVDSSGSMYTEALEQGLAEINAIHKNGIQVTVIVCDSEVRDVFPFDPKKKVAFKGRGGTLYTPALKKAEELKVDAIVFFGDADVFDEKIYKPKQPVLWAIVGSSPPPAPWGKHIKIEVQPK